MPAQDTTRINDRIRVSEVRLIGDDGKQIGIVKTPEALRYAQERDLDLVEVAADARPPVCRVLDYSKYKYEQAQKQKAARKHQQQITIREIKLRPKIADNDYETKKGHVERFLKHKDKVKITIMFRGREVTHPERGTALLQRLAEDVQDLGVIEQRPLQDGRNMTMLLGPSKAVLADQPVDGETNGAEPEAAATGPEAPAEWTRAAPPPFALLSASHAEAEDPFRREEALQGDRLRQGARALGIHVPHPREEVRQAEAPPVAAAGDRGPGRAPRQAAAREEDEVTRVKRSVHAKKKRRATLELTKGFRGEANSNYKRAKEALIKADQSRYRARRNRKRDFRRLWVTRINAAARQNGMTYGTFMHGLKLAEVELDRKVLADIAVRDPETFRRFADRAREATEKA